MVNPVYISKLHSYLSKWAFLSHLLGGGPLSSEPSFLTLSFVGRAIFPFIRFDPVDKEDRPRTTNGLPWGSRAPGAVTSRPLSTSPN
uniref:Uncharacterized protein n=1 Tax=Picea glauca TaxID=3330 RepID=A0A101LUN3_PICGL|nr:hypothetical protein ABT39_MTgene2496 [Picea glauca]KUM45661.1 hypothetical protein ABT39_MTgene2497 [Picea glauca]KUM45686.1 hypothetical protein ABT39_MTgene2522 [Picea glauca]